MIPSMIPIVLAIFVLFSATAGYAQLLTPAAPFPRLLGNTSALPPGWSGAGECLADCTFNDLPITSEFMSGPSFTDAIHMSIELCVQFCDAQGSRLAGLKGSECRCANIFNPSSCFESDFGECETTADVHQGCPGNRRESCGISNNAPPLFNIFIKEGSQFNCSALVWPGGAPLTAIGSWRFSYFYNDSESARALPQDAANLPVPLLRDNLTTTACVTACNNAGFSIAGVESGNECFCGNSIQNGAHPVTNCSLLPANPEFGDPHPHAVLMRCNGNLQEFCGGANIISIYTLPGTGLVPILPFDSGFDNFCSGGDCVGGT